MSPLCKQQISYTRTVQANSISVAQGHPEGSSALPKF